MPPEPVPPEPVPLSSWAVVSWAVGSWAVGSWAVGSSAVVSRRAALAGASAALAAGLLGSCAGQDAAPAASPAPTPTPTPTQGGALTPVTDPDVQLAAGALAAEQQQVALLAAAGRAFPALAGRLRGARVVHQRHVALLTDAAPSPPSSRAGPVRLPGSAPAALRAVVEGEQTLLDRHRASAGAAASGRFARVLASLAAAAAQQAVVLGGTR